VAQKRRSGTAYSMTSGVSIGVVISVCITLVGSWLLGKLLDAEKLRWEQIGYWIMLLIFLSTNIGASVAINKIKVKRMVSGSLTGCIYFLVLLITTALFFDGQYEAIWETLGLIAGGSILPALTKARGSTAKNKKDRRGYNC